MPVTSGLSMKQVTERFSDRVDDYIKYRPSYPEEVISLLRSVCGLNADSIVADIASGTGIFTRQLLETKATVFAIEPSDNMRHAAEAELRSYPAFKSIKGTAESTGMPDNSIDIITVAQAFHWFNQEQAKKEFCRIMRSEGWIALIWNMRRQGSEFLTAYDALLKTHIPEYSSVNHRNISDEMIEEFFYPDNVQ